MHTRQKFRDRLLFKHADTLWKSEREMVSPGDSQTRKGEAGRRSGEKRREVHRERPYRKPTQVDEERILRPTGEGLLRNSAN